MKDLSLKSFVSLAVAIGDTTPAPGSSSAFLWSTTTNSFLWWTGSFWAPAGSVTCVVTASEALTAGNLVSLWNNSSVASARKADSDAGHPADGFVLASYSSSGSALVFLSGENPLMSGLTIGQQFLSATAGGASTAVPSASGSLVQSVGFAVSSSRLMFVRGLPVTLT